jgi:hypothetical protein
VVHFHAIVRIDGVHPEQAHPAPPRYATTEHLLRAISAAARKTQVVAAPLTGEERGRTLAWGKQFDARAIVRRGDDYGNLGESSESLDFGRSRTRQSPPTSRSTRPKKRKTSSPPVLAANTSSGSSRRCASSPLSSIPRGPTVSCTAGTGCSASVVTSPPSPAATRSLSARSEAHAERGV